MEKIFTKEVVSTIFVIFITVLIYLIFKQLFSKIGLKKAKARGNRKAMTMLSLTLNVLKYILIIVAILTILDIWGVNTKALVASLGVVGVVAGLAMQDLLKDFISGTAIITENQFKVGDNIKIGDFRGTVISLGMKSTKIRAYTGEVKTISNRNITEVINYSMMPSVCVLDLGLSYEDDINKIETALKNVCESVSKQITYLKKPIKILGIEELQPSYVVYRIEAIVNATKDFEFKRVFQREIKKEAEKGNLTLSYEKLDVHNVWL